IIPVDRLYEICGYARDILKGEHAVGRVIARPFMGKPGSFLRTERRKDFSVEPPRDTLLDELVKAGTGVAAVGKIKEIFAGRGIGKSVHISGNDDGIDKTLAFMHSESEGLIFTNLVDFDMLYGHRNDPKGYARALEEFDRRLPEITGKLGENELLVLTADHGCDPTMPGTDHSREYVPLLVYGNPVKKGQDIGVRESFADLGATIAEIFGVKVPFGRSFLKEILRKHY
ncbi:MAG TPA: phosphopentomutase, partial [Clostridia bacterium]|nr:phosphopentomutase [Clostridia bacterium]